MKLVHNKRKKGMRIVRKGTFSSNGMPTDWWLDGTEAKEGEYCLGIDLLFPGSVDVNGVEIAPWTQERRRIMGLPSPEPTF